MGLAAVDAVLLDSNLLLELLEGLFSFRTELAVSTILGQTVFQLQEEFLHSLYIRTLLPFFRVRVPRVYTVSAVSGLT